VTPAAELVGRIATERVTDCSGRATGGAPSRRRSRRTGLGLALSSRLVEAMGADADGRSTLGEGYVRSSRWNSSSLRSGRTGTRRSRHSEAQKGAGSAFTGRCCYIEDKPLEPADGSRNASSRRRARWVDDVEAGIRDAGLAERRVGACPRPDLITDLPYLTGLACRRPWSGPACRARRRKAIPVVILAPMRTPGRTKFQGLLAAGGPRDVPHKPLDVSGESILS